MQICQKFKILYNKITTEPVILSLAIILCLSFILESTIKITDISQFALFQKYKSLLILLILTLQNLILLTPIAFSVKKSDLCAALGFKKFKVLNSLGWTIWGFVIFFIINFAAQYIEKTTGISVIGYGEQMNYLPLFGNDTYSLPVAITSIIIMAPIVEEIFFRGYIFTDLYSKYGHKIASIIASLIFAALHMQFNVFIPLFILGLIITTIRYKSDSIWPAIFFHVINNSLALIIEINGI